VLGRRGEGALCCRKEPLCLPQLILQEVNMKKARHQIIGV
jgi:hypothetical protein